MQPIDYISHIPFCPETGFEPGVTDKTKNKVARARLAQAMSDEEWLGEDRPFVPKDLEKFRSSQITTSLGDKLK